ncbi:MAG: biopolymer transporter ExbD [Phycisphaerales bacterium]|nr:biopolymer transporter ExbD [Phycisphaerales bacterium]
MRRIRRPNPDARIEITPMIDVVFLLLTFFIFSIVLMVRADVLDVQLPELSTEQSAEPVVPITVAITMDGAMLVNRDPIEADSIIATLQELQEKNPGAPIVIAVDTRSEAGVLIGLVDKMTAEGIRSFSIIGKRAAQEPEQP